jgi:para-nitrobenzyl esterase
MVPALLRAKEAAASHQAERMGLLKVCAEPVHIETGLVRGLIVGEANDIQLYRGVPFAAPPVGDLRWRPPQPAHAWHGVRESYAFGAAAPQKPVALVNMFPGMTLQAKTSEDCLYLNVWAPARRSAEPLPVMVWIHGGGYTFGAASQGLYDGANLARRGVVVVAMNYRLGPFGFLALPQLSAESANGASGNYGLLDQIEALRWVKRNVAAFGGDPDRVTIFGESAGGNSVYALLLSPLAKGLFQRAISQSGASLNFAHLKQSHYGFRPAEVAGLEFAKKCGAAAGPSQLAALRAMSADDVLKASSGFETARSLEFRSDRLRFGPIVDGWVIPDDPMTLFDKGQVNAVPLLVGANANEGSLFTLSSALPNGSEDYRNLLEKSFGKQAATTISELYPPSDLRRAVSDLMGDYLFVAPCRYVARAMQPLKNPVYLYHFAHPTPGPMGKMLGAHHGAEIAYALDNLQLAPHHSAVDDAIRDALAGYWVQFAATGNPNRPGLPDWPAYDAASDRCLLVKDTIETAQGLRKAKLDAIDRLMESWRKESGSADHPATTSPLPPKPNRPDTHPAGDKTTRLEPKANVEKMASRPATGKRAKLQGAVRKSHDQVGISVVQFEELKQREVLRTTHVSNDGRAPTVTLHAEPLKSSGVGTSASRRRIAAMGQLIATKTSGPLVSASRNQLESELRHARFLAKAGLGPMAVISLRNIIGQAPGSSSAREAEQLLESIPKAK